MSDINWSDPKSQLTTHFTVGDALYLPSWKVYHQPSDAEKINIIKAANMMEEIRSYLGDHPVHVNCWIRPLFVTAPGTNYNYKNYNQFVGGAQDSAHIEGLAVDFTVSTITCDDVRYLLNDKLEEFKIRMENKPGSGWVHCDCRDLPPGGKRFFKP